VDPAAPQRPAAGPALAIDAKDIGLKQIIDPDASPILGDPTPLRQDHVPKPVDADELLTVVASMVGRLRPVPR
jgi:hypothetical protein